MKKTVKLKFLIFFIIFISFETIYSQSKMDANTIFVCIPAEDYATLFSNSFVKDTLFICKENSTKTSTDEYTGNYFIGEFATLEFMQPSENNKFGDHLNDIGLEFKSRKIGLLDSLKNTNTNFEIEKTFIESDNEKHLWYDALQLKKYKTNFEFSILEYSAEELKSLGFTDDEIKKTISPTDFNKVVYGDHKYPRKFKSLKSIKLEVNAEGLNYLKQISKAFHFKMNNNSISSSGFTIFYTLNKNLSATKLKNITVNLNEDLKSKKIELTTHISISISKNTATIDFKN